MNLKLFLLFGLLFQSSLGYDPDAFVEDMENYDTSDVFQVQDDLEIADDDLAFIDDALPPPAKYSYFRIVNDFSYLTLCAVQLYGQLNGGGPIRRIPTVATWATQINTGWGGVASRAVDGTDDPNYFGGHCSHTVTQRGSWWQIRFSGLWTIRQVRILNRKDCCADRLRALSFYGSVDGRSFKKIGFYAGPGGPGAWVTVSFSPPPPPPPPPAAAKLATFFRITNGFSYLTLCAVQLFGQLNGVGPNKLINIPQSFASQINTGWGGVPGRAIDGVNNPNYFSGHCSHTVTQAGSWWQTRLPGRFRLRTVKILNRRDCCADRLRALTFSASTDGRSFAKIGSYAGPAGAGAWVTVGLGPIQPPPPPPTKKYRYFRIVNNFSYLTLCAVQLYGQSNGVGPIRRIPTNPAWATQINTGWGGVAGRAVDGRDDPNYFGGHCSHTVTQRGSWWQTSLPGFWTIKQVRILNRRDCCADRLRALAFYGSLGANGPFEKLGTYGGPGGPGAWIIVNLGGGGPSPPPPPPKYLSFRIVNGFSYLTLCGVELYGKRSGSNAEIRIPVNRATATQINTGWGGVPSRAVDGINNGNYFSGHCSHTVTQRGSWWQVALPSVPGGGWELTRVKIWNRADCCWDRLRSLSFYGGSTTSGGALKRIGVYSGPAGRGAVVEVRLNSRGMLEALQALDQEDYDFSDIDYDFDQEAHFEQDIDDDQIDDDDQADIEDFDEYQQYQNAFLVVNHQNQLFQLFYQYPIFSILAVFVLSFTFIYYFVNRKQGKTLLFNSSEYTPLKPPTSA